MSGSPLQKMKLRADHLFYIAFAIFLFQYILSYTLFTDMFGISTSILCNALKIISLSILFIKMLFQVYEERFLIPFFILGAIAVASLFVTFDQHLIVTIVFAASSQGVSLRKVAKVSLSVTLFMLIITVVCALTGAIESVSRYIESGNRVTSLGFTVPNRLAAFILLACVSFAIVRFPVIRLYDFAIYLAAALSCIAITGSNTGVLGILFAVLLVKIYSYCMSRGTIKPLIIGCIVFLLFLMIASLYFMVLYDPSNSIHAFFNRWLTGRLELSHRYFSLFPPTLFGNNFSSMVFEVGNYTTLVVDNAYSKLVIQIGYIPAVIFLILYVSPFVRSIKTNNRDLLCLYGLTVMAAIAFAESYAFHFVMNYSMMCLLGPLLECDRKKSKTGKFKERAIDSWRLS